jgi:general secretion pathway protein G
MQIRKLGSRGFTLMEIVVVLAVIAILGALLTPLILTYVEDGRRQQAQNDVQMIATAIAAFLKDTGVPPYKNTTSTTKVALKETNDFDCLKSSLGQLPLDDATTTWATALCLGVAADTDTIENQVILNTPAGSATKSYTTSGKFAWRGPYLPTVNADPWGAAYLVNIGKADPSVAKAVIVISAGANGKLETSADQATTTSITPGGDDILARVK